MPYDRRTPVAIVDYGMGNLFSVKHACEYVGMEAAITSDRRVIRDAPAVIVPGVGAFPKAMENLQKYDLIAALRDYAATGRPIAGFCLGMQLLMTESQEFGRHRGLGLIEGDVVRLDSTSGPRVPKVPNIGWNSVYSKTLGKGAVASWKGSLLAPLANDTYMYFSHSFYTRPANDQIVLAKTRFGSLEFCSSFSQGNIFACQFHPERSGPDGLKMYQALAEAANAEGASVVRPK